jgi:hypothetical protein
MTNTRSKDHAVSGSEANIDSNEAGTIPITISDILAKLNSTIQSHVDTDTTSSTEKVKGFELHTRLPDGSARPATDAEMATANFESKLQHSMGIVQSLPNGVAKLKWAEIQRVDIGNDFYQKQQYESAMDTYLTCLIVATPPLASDDPMNYTMEHFLLYMKVMNNLALCTMQLKWYRKTVTFCTMAIDQISTTLPMIQRIKGSNIDQTDKAAVIIEQRIKLCYKRAKAYRLKGEYDLAYLDLEYIQTELSKNATDSAFEKVLLEMNCVISKEEQLLKRSTLHGKKNFKQQQNGMVKLLNQSKIVPLLSNDTGSIVNDHNVALSNNVRALYYDYDTTNSQLKRRAFSTLRANDSKATKVPYNSSLPRTGSALQVQQRTLHTKSFTLKVYDAMRNTCFALIRWIQCSLLFLFEFVVKQKK